MRRAGTSHLSRCHVARHRAITVYMKKQDQQNCSERCAAARGGSWLWQTAERHIGSCQWGRRATTRVGSREQLCVAADKATTLQQAGREPLKPQEGLAKPRSAAANERSVSGLVVVSGGSASGGGWYGVRRAGWRISHSQRAESGPRHCKLFTAATICCGRLNEISPQVTQQFTIGPKKARTKRSKKTVRVDATKENLQLRNEWKASRDI